jgi:hypothetical protein
VRVSRMAAGVGMRAGAGIENMRGLIRVSRAGAGIENGCGVACGGWAQGYRPGLHETPCTARDTVHETPCTLQPCTYMVHETPCTL